MALAVCWMTICGPTTEGSGYILLAPTLAFAFLEGWHLSQPSWIRGLVFASSAAFTVAVLTCLTSRPSEGMAYGPHPLGGLLLMIAVAGEAIRRILAPAESVGTSRPRPRGPLRDERYSVGPASRAGPGTVQRRRLARLLGSAARSKKSPE